ncbi:coenzyme F420-0:L-glutamate ligase [Methanocaldococcus sp. 28A]
MRAYPIRTKYIKKGENFIPIVIEALKNSGIKLEDGDFVVLSEKMVSTAEGNFVDESKFKSGVLAYFCYYWSKYLWGYVLGKLFKIKEDKIKNLRNMPKEETLRHKQTIIETVGLRYALKPYAEGGIDLTNVPGTYACPLPKNPKKWAEILYKEIKKELGVDIVVMVADTDATYKVLNFYVTALPYAIDGIISGIGVFGFILGRLADVLKIGGFAGCTPLAIAGNEIYKKYTIGQLVRIAFICDRVHKTIKNINEVLEKYNSYIITEEILEKLEHTPVVVVKMKEEYLPPKQSKDKSNNSN